MVDGVGRAVSWMVLLVVLMLFVQLPLRQVFGWGNLVANDLGQLFHATLFMVGIPYAFRWGAHIRLDVLYSRMSERGRALVDLLGNLLLVLPWLGVVTLYGMPMVLRSVRELERFPETFTPGYFLLRFALLSFLALMALESLGQILASAAKLLRREP